MFTNCEDLADRIFLDTVAFEAAFGLGALPQLDDTLLDRDSGQCYKHTGGSSLDGTHEPERFEFKGCSCRGEDRGEG